MDRIVNGGSCNYEEAIPAYEKAMGLGDHTVGPAATTPMGSRDPVAAVGRLKFCTK
jgi:hypothetical protein